MIKEIHENLWLDLEEKLPNRGYYHAKKVGYISNAAIAVNHHGYRNFIIPISKLDEAVNDNRSRGLTVQGKKLIVNDEEEKLYIVITCSDKEGHLIFNLVISDILQKIEAGMLPKEAVSKTLDKWRKFWGGTYKKILTEEEIKGLFGELWFLSFWLLPNNPMNIKYWLGPLGNRSDIEINNLAIEIKTTSSVRGHIHRINGLDQLETPENGVLYLFSLRVRREESASNTLPILVEKVRALLASDSSLLDMFEERLMFSGYFSTHEKEYSEYKYRVVDERLYFVNDSFPRLSSKSFAGGLPNGVEHIIYDVNLEVCESNVVARYPSELENVITFEKL